MTKPLLSRTAARRATASVVRIEEGRPRGLGLSPWLQLQMLDLAVLCLETGHHYCTCQLLTRLAWRQRQ